MRRYHKKILLLKYFKIFLCDLVVSCPKSLHTSCSQQQIVQSVMETQCAGPCVAGWQR